MALVAPLDLANLPQSHLVVCAGVAPGDAAEVADGSIGEVLGRVGG